MNLFFPKDTWRTIFQFDNNIIFAIKHFIRRIVSQKEKLVGAGNALCIKRGG